MAKLASGSITVYIDHKCKRREVSVLLSSGKSMRRPVDVGLWRRNLQRRIDIWLQTFGWSFVCKPADVRNCTYWILFDHSKCIPAKKPNQSVNERRKKWDEKWCYLVRKCQHMIPNQDRETGESNILECQLGHCLRRPLQHYPRTLVRTLQTTKNSGTWAWRYKDQPKGYHGLTYQRYQTGYQVSSEAFSSVEGAEKKDTNPSRLTSKI